MKRRLLFLLLSLVLSGCGVLFVSYTSPEADLAAKQFSPKKGKGLLYFFWDVDYRADSESPLYINDRWVGGVIFASYLMLELDPGVYHLRFSQEENSTTVTVDDGDVKFLMQSYSKGYSRIIEVTEESGKEEVNRRKRAESVDLSAILSAGKPKPESSGSGFFINRAGDVVTNNHVIRGCRRLTTKDGNKEHDLVLRQKDKVLDLALLSSPFKDRPFVRLPQEHVVRQGETVVVLGYPLSSVLDSSLIFTKGEVNALSGAGDTTRIQISAQIQPGNSGGPVLNEFGQLAGVAVSTMSTVGMAQMSGSLVQNVNFAVKENAVKGFLQSGGVDYETSDSKKPLPMVTLADMGKAFTVMITCHR